MFYFNFMRSWSTLWAFYIFIMVLFDPVCLWFLIYFYKGLFIPHFLGFLIFHYRQFALQFLFSLFFIFMYRLQFVFFIYFPDKNCFELFKKLFLFFYFLYFHVRIKIFNFVNFIYTNFIFDLNCKLSPN